MINKILVPAIAIISLVISAATAYRVYAPSITTGETAGAAGGLLIENYVPAILYNDGYKSEKEIVLSGANGDLTVGGGLLTVTTTNTATSTAIVGCYQTYATSTATAWRQGIVVVGTSTAMSSGGTANGFVVAQYGSCPF